MQRRSLIAVLAGCAALVLLRTATPPRNVLNWDVFGYYLYLPATFIHHDLGLQDHAWLDSVMVQYEPSATLYQLVDGPDGNRVIKYSAGMAVLYAPFFLIANGAAPVLGFPADGFSPPYQFILAFGCLLYAVLGLFVLRKVLLNYFNDNWTALLLLLIVFGTNYLQLTAWDGTLLTHTPLFLLYALLLWATIRWHKQPGLRAALLIGASAGLITLVRPSEGVCLLIPLLWLPQGEHGWRRKWELLRTHYGQVVLSAAAFILAASPQLFYWHAVTGHWLFYSYVNPGEGFDFLPPHTVNFLLSYRKGWLLYTPLMAFALIGIPLLWRHHRETFWAVLLFFLADLWMISAWSTWWYAGGSFSSRSLVPAYTVLAIPLGVCLQTAWQKRNWRWPAGLLLALVVLLNLFQTWQWQERILPKDRITRAYYWAIFGRTVMPAGAESLLMVERSASSEEHFTDSTGYTMHELCNYTFDDRPDSSFRFTAEVPWTPGPDITYAELTRKDHAWLRASARLWVGDSLPQQAPPLLVMTFHHNGETYHYRTGTWLIPPGTRNTWVPLVMDYLTPEVRSPQDNLKVYAWNEHGGPWRVDDLRVEVWEPRR
ncbi:MAG: hypothetical protein JST38_08505 [Bacteroidetes bacterium]|nr:hypothetical protein [Bacteroidota bacterium]MBS1940903.1 hypothetical protein [Bacteroidota bacterium]